MTVIIVDTGSTEQYRFKLVECCNDAVEQSRCRVHQPISQLPRLMCAADGVVV